MGGYLGLPDLTNDVFIDNPFHDIPGKTVYRTGDLGCINNQGMLEYHGRKDGQVKIRGVRIDLGEIEHVVTASLDGHVEALATTYETADGDRVIGLAYSAPTTLESNTIIDAIRRKLPSSHIPKALLQVPSIPLTVNGKADRRKLTNEFQLFIPSNVSTTRLDKIIDAFRVYLPRGAGEDTNFFESGGDSLDAVNLSLNIEQQFKVSIDASKIYSNQTPRLLKQWLDGGSHPNPISQQSTLPIYDGPEFRVAATGQPQHILLTGATGFVGVHLLEHLLRESEAVVSMIIRSECVEGAVSRMHSAAAAAEIDLSRWAHRLRILPGNLAKPQLGCGRQRWEWLAQEVDTIVHAGAEVNFLLTYQQLYAANVQSTEELIRLCATGRPKRFHYISSFAARKGDTFSTSDSTHSLSIDQLITAGANGYAATKVACEKLLHGAAAVGLDTTVYRLDDVLPSIVTGVANKRSVIYRFFRLCYGLRIAPVNVGGIAALTIDEAAGYLAGEVCQPACLPVTHGQPRMIDVTSREIVDITHLLRSIEQVTGCQLTHLSYPSFCKHLEASTDPTARLIHTVLPPPAETNSIFGPAVGGAVTSWDGNYRALATAFAHYRIYFEQKDIAYGTIESALC